MVISPSEYNFSVYILNFPQAHGLFRSLSAAGRACLRFYEVGPFDVRAAALGALAVLLLGGALRRRHNKHMLALFTLVLPVRRPVGTGFTLFFTRFFRFSFAHLLALVAERVYVRENHRLL